MQIDQREVCGRTLFQGRRAGGGDRGDAARPLPLHQHQRTGHQPARLNTGIEIQVPEYITTGEKVLVSTVTGEFSGRA